MKPLNSHRASAVAFAMLGLAPAAHAQAFLTWTGTGNNWNNTSRWDGWDSGGFPYGQLQFSGGGDATSNNNFAPANAWRMFFNGNLSYSITGNEIRLFDYGGAVGGIMSRASGNQLISANVRFSDSGARAGFISTRMGGSGTGGGGGSLTFGNIEIAGAVTELRFSGEVGAGAITVNGIISGSGKPLVIGRDHNNDVQNGTFVSLNGDNTYSGGTTLRTGTLRAGHNNALGSGKLTIDSDGSSVRTLASSSSSPITLGNNIDLFNNLTLGQASGGTGSLTLSGSVFLGNDAGNRVLDVTGSHSITGGITGSRGLVKQGSGTLVLSGNSTFSGGVTVSAGTLLANGELGSGTVNVTSGATIGGNGLIAGNLVMDAGSFLNISDPGDVLGVQGTVTLGSGFGINNLTGFDWDALTLNQGITVLDTTTVFDTGSISNFGIANATAVGSLGRSAYFQNGSLQVVVIPEPSTLLTIPLGLLALSRRRRTR